MGQGSKGRRGLHAKTTEIIWLPEELASLKISTSAIQVPSLFLGVCLQGKKRESMVVVELKDHNL